MDICTNTMNRQKTSVQGSDEQAKQGYGTVGSTAGQEVAA